MRRTQELELDFSYERGAALYRCDEIEYITINPSTLFDIETVPWSNTESKKWGVA